MIDESGGGPEGSSQRFPRAAKIRSGDEIRGLFRTARRRRVGSIDVLHQPAVGRLPRLGVVVPKHRHEIVERNLVRRRLREIGRRDLLPLLRRCGVSVDLLLRARPEAYAASYDELRTALLRFTEGLCSDPSYSG